MIVSFVIPLYNCAEFIETCLNSILQQDVPFPYEIIVVNDGSTDGGEIKVRDFFQKEYSHIKLINQENKGISAARNRGLNEAQGNFVWFLDSDDRIVPNCLAPLFFILEKEKPDLMRVEVTNVNDPDPSGDELTGDFSYRVTHSLDIETHIFFNAQPIICNSMYAHIMSIDKIKKLKLLFNTSLATLEDQVFLMEFLYQAEKAVVTNANIYRRYIRSNSIMHNKDISHLRKYNQGRVNAAIAIKKLNERFREKRTTLCYDTMNDYCNDKAMQGLINMARNGCDWMSIKDSIRKLRLYHIYPFNNYSYFKLKGLKWRAIKHIANSPLLLFVLSKFFKSIK